MVALFVGRATVSGSDSMKMLLRYIDVESLTGLMPGRTYYVDISAKGNEIWVKVNFGDRMVMCSYDSIRDMLDEWEEI